ncbi:MAG: capsule assembly Wzi family protein [Treponema sp.]|jgi:hypothetical protein|nr:capsule assembly Wzi family protein [Treponema sp.]
MKTPIFILTFLLTTSIIFAQPLDMIPAGDPILEDIRYLSLVSGKPFLSFSPPLAPGEIKDFLEAIDENELNAFERETYNRVLRRLSPSVNRASNGYFTSSFDIYSTVEVRANFNSDVSGFPQNPNIVPFFAFPVNLFFAETFQLFIEPSITMRPTLYGSGAFGTNIPVGGYPDYDESNPLRAFAAVGGNWWSFQIGRDRLFWGTGHTGSLTFNDNSQYFDFARFSVFSPKFKYSFIVNQLPLKLTRNLFDERTFNNSPWDDPAFWDDPPSDLTLSNHRYFYLHRFDFILFNRLSIGIMEGLMAGNSPLELRYLNPFIVFHSFFSWDYYDQWNSPYDGKEWSLGHVNGSFLSLEVNWNIFKKSTVYGQMTMNTFALPWYDNPQPNSIGYMSGFQYTHSFNGWASISFIEFFYTSPYFNILSSPHASFIQQNRYDQYYFLGYSRDTISLTLGTRFFNNDTLSFSTDFSWITSGEYNKNGLVWNYKRSTEAFKENTPTGIAENKFILSLGAGWKLYTWLGFKTNITGIYSINNNHQKGDTAIGGQASFSVSLRY